MASQEVSEHVEHVDDPHLTVRRTLPLVGERTWWHVQGQVAVQLTLPLGGERAGRHAVHCHSSVNVRGGTFRVEWQCRPHCHSASSVPHWHVQRRVAVLAGTDSGPAAVTPIGEWPNWANALGQPPAKSQGGRAEARRPWPGARPHGKAQSEQRASLMARPRPGRDTIRLPVMDSGGAGNSG